VATAPQYTKKLDANGDGTYTLSLSVTGKSSSSTQSSKADVIVVLDTSGSMGDSETSTTLSYAKVSWGHENDSYGLVNGAYVPLTHTGWGWNESYSYTDSNGQQQTYTRTRYYQTYAETTRLAIAKQAVDKLAKQLLANNTTANPDAVQLSLVTFASTARAATTPTTDLNTFTGYVDGTSADGGTNWEDALATANGVKTRDGASVYVIFVSDGDPTFRLSYGSGDGHDGYEGQTINGKTVYGTGNSDDKNNNYNAALTQAEAIVTAKKTLYSIGVFGNADKMQNLATDSGAGASNYYKADDETGINAAFASIIAKITNAATYENVVITDGVTSMTSTDADLLNVDSTSFTYTRSDGETYTGPKATYDGKKVTWNMGSTPLADGVTYTVSFRVWPSQAAYDLVAALMNGTETYNQLSETDKAQIVKNDDGTYSLKTNTENSLSYDQVLTKTTNQKPAGTTNSDGSISGTDGYKYTYDSTTGIYTGTKTVTGTPFAAPNPDGIPLTVATMPVSKAWSDGNDAGSVTLTLVTDGNQTAHDPSFTLTSANHWKSSVYIAPGLQVGTDVLDSGHDYTLVETNTDSSYEYSSETAHPMLVNGTLDYGAGSDNVLTGTNTHKGSLKITKTVVGTGYNADTKFTFVIGLGSESSPVSSDDSGNESLEYRIYDADNKVASSGKIVNGTATVSITASQYILVVDVPTDTPYSVYETDVPDGFRPTGSSNAIGKIAANTQTASSFTNTYAPGFLDYTTSYTVTKTWDDSDNAQGTRPDSLAVALEYSVDGGATWKAYGDKVTLTQAADGTWSYTFTNLPMFNTDGSQIMYRAAEDTPANYTGTTTVTPTYFKLSTDWNAITRVTPCNDTDFTIESGGVGVVIAKLTTGNKYFIWTSKPLTSDEKAVVNTIANHFFSSFEAANTTYGSGNPATYVNGKQGSVTISADAKTGVHVDFTGESVWAQWAYGTITTTSESTPGTTSFTNKLNTGSLSITKTVTAADGVTAPENAEFGFTVTLGDANGAELKGTYAYTVTDKDGKDVTPETATITSGGTITLKAGWTATINGLVAGTSYDVSETSIPNGFTNTSKTADTGAIANGVTAEAAFTNTYELTSVNITKSWADDSNRDGIRTPAEDYASMVTLYADGHALVDTKPVVTDNGDNTYTVTFSSLPKTTTAVDSSGAVVTKDIVYTVGETSLPDGYVASYSQDGLTITNTHTPATTSAKATKSWDDSNNQDGKRTESVTLQLRKSVGGAAAVDVEGKTLTLDAGSSWTGTIDNLPAYEGGKAVTYSFVETSVPDGYAASYAGDAVNGITVTNTHTPATTSAKATKVWSDNDDQDGIRANVTLHLTKTVDGETSVVKDQDRIIAKDATGDALTVTWNDLPVYESGSKITYGVTEDAIEGYETGIVNTETDDGLSFTVTNTHTPAMTSAKATKVWSDNSNQDGKRPTSVTLQLQKSVDGAAAVDMDGETLTLNDGNEWVGTIENLPAYEGGKAVTYSFRETDTPDGYSATYAGDAATGITVTNTHTPETTSVSGTKVWADNSNQDGKRPTSVVITLTGTVGESTVVSTASKTVTGKGDTWAYSFTDLPKYSGGQLITYTVSETSVPDGYSASYAGDAATGITVTNSHTPEVVSVSGSKTWDDANDQDGKRPESITVNLLANGTVIKTAEATAENRWSYSFTDLPKYSGGQQITYTITEGAVDDYTPSISGYNVTNSYTPGVTSVSVTKAWEDGSDQDGIRPDSVTVQLYADGVAYGEPVELSEGNNWTFFWTKLPINKPKSSDTDETAAVVYTVRETSTPDGYASAVSGDAKAGFTVTNTHTPATASVSATKTWDDADDQDGIRPASITYHLLADGVEIDSQTVTAAGGWSQTWDNLPVNKDHGTAIAYTVTEDAVTGYTTSVSGDVASGFKVTNTHTPEVVSVSGTKTWVDGDDQDGIRPDSVTVNLLANGTVVGTAEVTAENGWSYSFTDLPKYSAGQMVSYSVEEVPVPGYQATKSGYDLTNTHVPATGDITVTKVWSDSNDKDGIRPASVTVRLYADGIDTGRSVTLSADDSWTATFSGLATYDGGSGVTYSVVEDAVSGYTAAYTSGSTGSITVTNTHVPTITPKVPDTGDASGIGVLAALLAGAAAVAAGAVARRRDQE